MATHASCYQLEYSREHSTPSSHPNAERSVAAIATMDLIDVQAKGQTLGLDLGPVRPSAWAYNSVSPAIQPTCPIKGFVGPSAGEADVMYEWLVPARVRDIDTLYYKAGAAVSCLTGISVRFQVQEGRMAPQPSFFSENFPALNTIAGICNWSNVVPYTGDRNIIVFEEYTGGLARTEGQGNPGALLQSLKNPGVSVAAGADTLEFCSLAGVAPDGTIWIDPADIGSGPNQIPASVQDNTAARFQAHPSAFVPSGKTRYIRSVSRMAVDYSAINAITIGQPLRIRPVMDAPTKSTWLVGGDGTDEIVTIAHPEGSDFRRPKDIWNNVIMPFIQGQQIASLLGFSETDALAVASNMRYTNYWRCLSIENEDNPITQTDSTPPG